MKISRNHTKTGAALMAGLFTMLAQPIFAQEPPPEKAQVLLDKVKQSELNRQVSAKQTEIDRLKEDLDKAKKDADGLQQTIEATATLVNESSDNLERLSEDRKHLEQVLHLTNVQIDAEQEKIVGLRNLSMAQSKSLSALNRRIEETDARSRVRTAEMELLAAGKLVSTDEGNDKAHADLLKMRKTLATAEVKTASEEKMARDAMKAASSKVQVADLAAARAKRLSDEMQSGDAEPVGEQPAEEKPAPAPVPKAVPVKASAQPMAAPVAAQKAPAKH